METIKIDFPATKNYNISVKVDKEKKTTQAMVWNFSSVSANEISTLQCG